MEIRHLRHFLALASEGNFTRAAARESIVQSGLSSSIAALERDLGVLLYVRNTRPVRLTAEGTALVPFARRTLDAADAASQAVREVHGALSGKLRIGTVQTRGNARRLSEWLGEFTLLYPGLDLFIQQMPANRMIAMLTAGDLDCVVGPATDSPPAVLDITHITSESLELACLPHHPLAGKMVDLTALAGERFVETHPGWASRMQTDAAFAAAGITRRVTCEVGEWGMVIDMVKAGLGIAFVPDVLRKAEDDLATIVVKGLSLPRTIDLILPSGHAATPAARRFADFVQQQLAGAVD
ncbi:MAG: transcriptional regulator, LysR family [Glaciihabitans sp.]|nr:transcriptional regulator, LysR family [Glaciihabitans sp.]